LIEQRGHVIKTRLLLLWRAAEVAIRPHAGTDRTAGKSIFLEFGFDVRRIDVRRVLDWYFDRIEAPFLKVGKSFVLSFVNGEVNRKVLSRVS